MSSSDYTNLRRIRHIYYPTLSNTVNGCAPSTVTYSSGNSYILPATVPINHIHGQQMHAHNLPVGVSHVHTVPTVPTHTGCDCGHSVAPQTTLTTNIVPQTTLTTNTVPTTTTVPITTGSLCGEGRITHSDHLGYTVEQVLPDKTSMVQTLQEYFIQPSVGGTCTFLIDKCLTFSKGSFVTCVQDVSNTNYFEGEISSYNKDVGLLQIFNISIVNGEFKLPSKFTISILPAAAELNLLRTRMAALYKEVFNQVISAPSVSVPVTSAPAPAPGALTVEEVATATTQTKVFNSYFFADDSGIEQTEESITIAVNNNFNYFFEIDVTATGSANFNPNNNGVVMSTLIIKIEQMNLYFFGSTNPTIVS